MNTAPRRGLGRGLGELLTPRSEPEPRTDQVRKDAEAESANTPADDEVADRAQTDNPDQDGDPSTPAVMEHGAYPGAADVTVGSGGEESAIPGGSYFAEIPVMSIRANPRQPRAVFDEEAQQELVDSVAEIGVLQPVVVRPLDDTEASDAEGLRYELVMGERRWRAVQSAGLDTIPAIVRRTEEHAMLRDALLENLHRTELNPLEEASAYRQLLDDFECTQDELAGRIKRSRPQISNTLRLLRLPPTVQRRVAAGVLSAGHARALLGVEDLAAQERLAQRVVAEGLSVRATEEVATVGGDSDKTERKSVVPQEPSPHASDLAERLSDHLETRVRVTMSRRGKITIDFATEEDLERIADLITETQRAQRAD